MIIESFVAAEIKPRGICVKSTDTYGFVVFTLDAYISSFPMQITLKAGGMRLTVVTELWTPMLFEFLTLS